MFQVTNGVAFAAYTAYTIVRTLICLPAYLGAFAVPALRPNSAWTYYQALSNHLSRTIFYYISVTEFPTPKLDSIKPGSGDLIRIKSGPDSQYQDVLDVRPVDLVAIWVPNRPQHRPQKDELIVLHFHGGAYVMLSPAMAPTQEGPRLLAAGLNTSILMPAYRLSRDSQSHFPAALQDAITAYRHLLNEGYKAYQIVLSGDSAGGNLVFALLRYIGEHAAGSELPWPAAALTWSPWTDMTMTTEYMINNPNFYSDSLSPPINSWGVRAYVPPTMSPSMPYFSPGRHPFYVGCKLFIHSGTAELLSQQHREAAAAFKTVPANQVEFCETANTPHDIFAAGKGLGFPREQQEILEAAIRLVQGSKSC